IRQLTSTILALLSLMPGLIQSGLDGSHVPFENWSQDSHHRRQESPDILGPDEEQEREGEGTKPDSESHSISEAEEPLPDLASMQMSQVLDWKPEEAAAAEGDNEDFAGFGILPLEGEAVAEEAGRRLAQDEIINRPPKYFGLPLQLFSCHSHCMPYFALSYYDLLTSDKVRSCIAGSSNQ